MSFPHAQEAALPLPTCSARLPTKPGFYWWRVSAIEDWRMVHIVDFALGLPEEPAHLAAYDVEKGAWGGRTLRMWEIHDPIGEWIECAKPNTKVRDAVTPNSNPSEDDNSK